MDVLWLLILGLLAAGWFALDGFSLGLGMLLPWLGRDAGERRLVVTAMAPFFLANEVWLIATAGVLIGAFPAVEVALLSGLYPAVVVVLVAWMVRDASVWFRSRRPSRAWRGFWDTALCGASLVFAGSVGVLFGNAVQGIPASGVRPAVLNPYALLFAAAVVGVFAVHGAAFVASRTGGAPGDRAVRAARLLAVPAAGLLLAAVVAVPAVGVDDPAPATVIGVVGLVALVAAWLALRAGRPGRSFAATLITAAALPLMVGAGVAAELFDGAAEPASLRRLAMLAVPAIPLLLLAQAALWWAFRHRVDERSVTFF